ncbi:MAG: 1-acyl-sn-glycerol-3-phosphate acyltransferase, partial [Armatimonadetes bacterium]|nr:1-acyl-sn-glycerol-3-phosphate acyltransferase [Armatimonadota bacterium]
MFSVVMTPVAKSLRAIGSGTRIRANRLVAKWRRRKGLRFCPPKYSPWVVNTVNRCLPWILKTFAEVRTVEVRGIENLKGIAGERAVITPNHPTRMDALLALELSRQSGERFNYIASRETFALPLLGWLVQR